MGVKCSHNEAFNFIFLRLNWTEHNFWYFRIAFCRAIDGSDRSDKFKWRIYRVNFILTRFYDIWLMISKFFDEEFLSRFDIILHKLVYYFWSILNESFISITFHSYFLKSVKMIVSNVGVEILENWQNFINWDVLLLIHEVYYLSYYAIRNIGHEIILFPNLV